MPPMFGIDPLDGSKKEGTMKLRLEARLIELELEGGFHIIEMKERKMGIG